MDKKKKRKIEFSKIITIISIVLFGIVLYKSFTCNATDYMDTAFIVTAITVTGGICGTCIVWMLKKSQSENVIKIRMGMYEDVKRVQLDFNEQMLILQNKYNVSDEDLQNILGHGDIDDFADEVLQETNSEMLEYGNDANSIIESQNY